MKLNHWENSSDEHLSSKSYFSFIFFGYSCLFLHETKPYLLVNFWIDTFRIRGRKVI